MKLKLFLHLKVIVLVFFLFSTQAFAHPGRTDSSGCHTCRTNCTSWGLSNGEYHCHQAKTSEPQPFEPVKSHREEGGVGYTEPAPEYKEPVNEGVKVELPAIIPFESEDETPQKATSEAKEYENTLLDEVEADIVEVSPLEIDAAVVESSSGISNEAVGDVEKSPSPTDIAVVNNLQNDNNKDDEEWVDMAVFWTLLIGGGGYYAIKKIKGKKS